MLVLESHLGLITEGQFPIWGQAEDSVHTWELIYRVWPGCWGPPGSLIFPSSVLDKSHGTMAIQSLPKIWQIFPQNTAVELWLCDLLNPINTVPSVQHGVLSLDVTMTDLPLGRH